MSTFNLGFNVGSSGTYALSGGSLSADSQFIGWYGSGAFTQSGGTNTTANFFNLGFNVGSSGTYTLSGGSLSADSPFIGNYGSGAFTQTGGTNSVGNYLFLGFYAGSNGTYALSDGSLSADTQFIGYHGSGAFTQTGGTNTLVNYLSLGDLAGGSGIYTLGGGTGSPVLSAQNEYIGNSGSGAFTQLGGTNTVSNTLTLARNSGSSGAYNLIGGSLSAATVNINSGGFFNQTGGTLSATTGLTNAGLYTMAGGTLSGATLTNNATFSGYGTITTTTGFNNYGTMTLTGGDSTINGDFTNQTSGFLYITNNPATFNGNVNNSGYIKVTQTTGGELIIVTGYTYTGAPGSTYISDPTPQKWENLMIQSGGALIGGAGDKWILSGDFINQNTQNPTWDTAAAALVFTNVPAGSLNHLLALAGADLGQTAAGYTDNFAWGSLDLTGQTLTLADGNDTPGGAFYVGSILGATIEGGKVIDIFGNDLNIYYNSDLAANGYLGGLTYELAGGGWLAPVAGGLPGQTVPTPLPASVWLFLSGLAGLGLLRRKKFRGPKNN